MQQNDTPPRLTPAQAAVLEAMIDHLVAHASPPSLREIGRVVGLPHVNGVREHVERLARKGYVVQPEGEQRHWWPCRLVDGTAVRWRITPEAVDPIRSCP